MPALEPLPAVRVRAIEVVIPRLTVAQPWRTAHDQRLLPQRHAVLVRVLADEAEGWAECPVEEAPTYDAEYADAAELVLRRHLVPRAWDGPNGDAQALEAHLAAVRGHHPARAALLLAVLDAQLQSHGRSLAWWLGATAATVPAGAALALHDAPDDLLAEAEVAVAAGAARLRVKVAPGRAATHLRALRALVGDAMPLQADANGSFTEDDPELSELDEVGLACLEQPLPPDDLLGHARLARRLRTPLCLDEPLTSLGAVETALALGACQVVCLKPSRVGGWAAARAIHDRCAAAGVPVWVGGMRETAVGRAANLALAALPGMSMAPDADPRARYQPDLLDVAPAVDGCHVVPEGPGTGAAPDPARLDGAARTTMEAP